MDGEVLYGYKITKNQKYNITFRSMNVETRDLAPKDENGQNINFVFDDLENSKKFIKKVINIAYNQIKNNNNIKGDIIIENFESDKENDYDTKIIDKLFFHKDCIVVTIKKTSKRGLPYLFRGIIQPITFNTAELWG